MALGLASTYANEILNAMGNDAATTNLSALTGLFIKLHTADPGASGTNAVAGNATVKSISFGTAAAGSMTNDVAITWSTAEVDTAEDYTHFSLWAEIGATTFVGSGLVTANAVLVGDEFTIPIGSITLSFATAA